MELGRVSLLARLEFIPAVQAFVRAMASELAPQDADKLELVLEEACLNVVQHAFEPGEEGRYEVVVERHPTRLVVAVEDRGLPLDPRREGHGLGLTLMRAFADRIRFVNLGTRGKRLELVKNLPFRNLEQYLGSAPPAEIPPDTPLELRLMRPQDTPSLARCVYRCYGFTYPKHELYYPERTEQLLRSGLLVSAVAVTPEGEIAAHSALARGSAEERIADSCQAVTDPRFRGRSLFTRLKRLLVEEGRRRGLLGIYSESVTVHPYTQKGSLALGAHETGVLLGFAPSGTDFKQIHGAGERTAVMLTYLRANPEPHRVLFPPDRHRELLGKIVDRLGLDREWGTPVRASGPCQMRVVVVPDLNAAMLQVERPGEDLTAMLRAHLHNLCQQRLDVFYLDLPLSDPGVGAATAELEELGFFFAAMVPEGLPGGDSLRLQYLNNVEVKPAAICTASDWGKELLAYVLEAGKDRLG